MEPIESSPPPATATAPSPSPLPAGFVSRDEARRVFGVTERQWKHWITDGKVRCGVIVPCRVGGRCTIYPLEELRKLRERMYARDVLYNYAQGNYHVPPGWARSHESCKMFGVDRSTWNAWARDGLVPPGQRFDGGPTLYPIEDLKNALANAGVLGLPYPDPQRSGAYRVPLVGGSARSADGREAIIDADALPLLDGATLSWESVKAGAAVFVGLCRGERPRGVALRRVIMGVTDDDMQVGHINGDPLDCRRANLLARTIQQRTHGARKIVAHKGRPCTSRYKGVCFESWTKKWRACIVVDGKRHSLGRYGDETAAAQAYDEAARRWFGKYAWLNFPDGVIADGVLAGGVDTQLQRNAA